MSPPAGLVTDYAIGPHQIHTEKETVLNPHIGWKQVNKGMFSGSVLDVPLFGKKKKRDWELLLNITECSITHWGVS